MKMNKMKVYKKYAIFIFLLIILLIFIPFVQSLLFTQSNIVHGRIAVNETIEVPFLTGHKKDTIVLFFGYVGCTEVCAPILKELKSMYEKQEFEKFYSSVDIIFVNLLSKVKPAEANRFAETFNKNFQGIYLSQSQLFKIERKFRLFFSQNLLNKTKLNHTDYIYLIERQNNGQFILKNIYNTHPFMADALINDLNLIRK